MIHKTLYSVFLITLFSLCLLFLNTCKKDPTSPGENEPQTTVAIGPDGGEIIADELTFTVPPAAFNALTDITILSSATDKPFKDSHSSKLYQIQGLPLDYTKPLKISIKYSDGSTSGENLLVIGEESVAHGELGISYTFLPSSDSTGYMVCELPIPEQVEGVNKLFKPNLEAVTVYATTVRHGIHTSSDGHFIIGYSDGNISGAQELGEYLEEAYQKVLGLGFKYEERTNWNEVPVAITLRKLKDGTDGLTSCSWFGNNHGYIEFNTDLLTDYPRLRITAGHEFFHLIQFLYDTRSGIKKSSYSSTHHWINEATAAWFEEKFTNLTNYVPEVVLGWEPTSLDGMQISPYDDNGELVGNFMPKCYGRTSIIKYLVEKYGEDNIVKIFDDIKNGLHPVNAVCQIDPNEWWVDFLKEHILGNVYPNSAEEWIGSNVRSGDFQINSNSDLLQTFTNQFKDLSGRLYFIRLNDSNMDSKAQIKFSITGAQKRYLTIFRFNNNINAPNTLEYLASGPNEVIIKNISNYNANRQHLLALVSNNRYTPPYTWDNEISLEVKIEEEEPAPDYNYCSVSIRTVYNIHWEDSYDNSSGDRTDIKLVQWGFNGTMNGNTFNGNAAQSSDNNNIYQGAINVNLNDNMDQIVNYTMWLSTTKTYSDYTEHNNVEVFNINGGSLTGSNAQFKTEGVSTCSHITSNDFTGTYNSTDVGNGSWLRTLVETTTSSGCDAQSKIEFTFSKQ